jgi:hypothetical protein
MKAMVLVNKNASQHKYNKNDTSKPKILKSENCPENVLSILHFTALLTN